MYIVLSIILYLFINNAVFADETGFPEIPYAEGRMPPTAPPVEQKKKEVSITEAERLKIENIQLQIQVLQQNISLFVRALMDKYKIEGEGWTYDSVNGKFIKSEQENQK